MMNKVRLLSKALWQFLRRPSAKLSVGLLLVIGFIGALILHGTYNATMKYTSTLEFCSSCHTNDVVPEYQQSAHFSNASGVQADCASCHLPKEFLPKMIRKVQASKEVFAHITGKVDTPEEFEAHRREMAEREWARMEANDSQECRNCHTQESMELSEQSLLAVKSHTTAEKNGETCIQCHKGIAHKLPDMTGVPGWE
ncbi:NapC/NirT family cytochrome c [Endozoicomonas sp. 4G]|uniref:NapC/NirT family cytochrome c n=1 Tax=Endozoicomonas sp. 4G TaxID=2872754 RepID=UPI002078E82A|nr:NapC/NirT family cytochrome c [Endozoicomonas sp. 4G]